MSQYLVSARKYRPTTFKDMVGQRSLTTTLKNAILDNKLAHAYLFCGPRGVGKTSCARIFAKTVNCSNRTAEGEACNACESCVSFNEQRSFNIIELDAASNNSVDNIRTLIDQVQVPPMVGKYKVFIIDEVHMLSQAAFNAFLKTLEEPPEHAIFVLATTDKHKVLTTIISRCQTYDFSRISVHDIAEHLSYVANCEGIETEKDALHSIALHAEGGMRDALSIFDQISSYTQGHITREAVLENLHMLDDAVYFYFLFFILKGDYHSCLQRLDETIASGFEPLQIMMGLSMFFRNVLLAQDTRTIPMVEVPESVLERYVKAGKTCPRLLVWNCLNISSGYEEKYRQVSNKRLAAEVALLKMCSHNSPDLQENSCSGSTAPPSGASQPTNASSPNVTSSVGGQSVNNTPSATPNMTREQTSSYQASTQPRQTVRKPREKHRMSFSITNAAAAMHESEQEQDEPKVLREKPFDSEILLEAWAKYTAAQETRIILKHALIDCQPHLGAKPNEICIPLYNSEHESLIRNVLSELREWLSDALENDRLLLTPYLVENPGEKIPVKLEDKVTYFSKNYEWFDLLRIEGNLVPVQ